MNAENQIEETGQEPLDADASVGLLAEEPPDAPAAEVAAPDRSATADEQSATGASSDLDANDIGLEADQSLSIDDAPVDPDTEAEAMGEAPEFDRLLSDPDELDLAEPDLAEPDFSQIKLGAQDESSVAEQPALSAEPELEITATSEELKPAIEALLFVADEPLTFKQLCKFMGDVPETDVQATLAALVAEYDARGSGLEIREIAGGWRISTRPQSHEFIRKYLKSRPSARLSLPALETLAVIAYKQPVTVPEVLEIRGVTSSSAIKTLLEKRLIITKGRKETVGRPMMYGTSKEFLIQFGLKDLGELPSIEDFEDLSQ